MDQVLPKDLGIAVNAAAGNAPPLWKRQVAELVVAVAKLNLPRLPQKDVLYMVNDHVSTRLNSIAGPGSELLAIALKFGIEVEGMNGEEDEVRIPVLVACQALIVTLTVWDCSIL